MTPASPPASTDGQPGFLAGGGEMGALIRAHDWAATPLGAPGSWRQGLRTAVRTALTTRHPVFMDFHYKDYTRLVAVTHTDAQGKEIRIPKE